ncbi:hypothetical protein MTO96_047023, partial [Rhipicephalus appendiculatus]
MNLQMKIKFDFTRRQERHLIVGFQADGQKYVQLQEDTTAPSLDDCRYRRELLLMALPLK